MRLQDFTGETVGRLTILERAPDRFTPGGHREVFWRAVCSCGTERDVSGQRLRNGQLRSCGCLSRELAKERLPQDVCGYNPAHLRVKKIHGSASKHRCRCGAQASDWAYQHGDPNEVVEGNLHYSLDPEFYKPMCRPCHARFDREWRASK